MAVQLKKSGAWVPPKGAWKKIAGVQTPGKRVFKKNAGAWSLQYQGRVTVTISANMAHVDISTLFTAPVWTDVLIDKEVVVAPGVTVWGYTNGTPAMRTGTGRGGKLYIQVAAAGAIRGHAGAANSGVGGTALLIEQNNVQLDNAGTVAGGGGGGGKGGQGGPGSYQTPFTATEGPTYSIAPPQYYFYKTGGFYSAYWAGTNFGSLGNVSSFSSGGWTYYRNVQQQAENLQSGTPAAWSIYRQQTQYTTTNTTGGAGGAGGTGQGFNSSFVSTLTSGSAGSAGGTNAGTGATGGAGGAWGTAGSAGPTGGAGNNGSGSAGTAGGLAGYYISGVALLAANNNTGSLLGRVA